MVRMQPMQVFDVMVRMQLMQVFDVMGGQARARARTTGTGARDR